jgi:uncharacterized membrane protein YjgN (DUF898 family)
MKTLSFEGSGAEYFKIWIVNILLIVVTLGLYYPWAKVRNLRYFYGNSILEGRNFEYHATGKQLFVAYLIAMALFIGYITVQNIFPLASGIVVLIFFLGFPWVIWRSFMFGMRMTSFSNVRFSFTGSLGGAYINFLLIPIGFFVAIYIPIIAIVVTTMFAGAITATIGIVIAIAIIASLALALYFFALIKKRHTSYAINGYRYGQGQFITTLTTKAFIKIALKTLGLGCLVMLVFFGLIAVLVSLTIGFSSVTGIQDSVNNPEAMQHLLGSGIVTVLICSHIGMIIASFLIMAYSHTRQRSYIFANTRLDDEITFHSSLTMAALAWVMISNLLLIMLTLGLALPWAKVRMTTLVLTNTHVNTELGFDHYISQQQTKQSALGDQIGDAFDVDVGLAI